MSTTIAMPQPTYASAQQPTPGDTHAYPPSDGSNQSPETKPEVLVREDVRSISRTPSPTQSEIDLLNGVRKKKTWQELISTNASVTLTYHAHGRTTGLYIVIAIIIVVIALVEVYHDRIITALRFFVFL